MIINIGGGGGAAAFLVVLDDFYCFKYFQVIRRTELFLFVIIVHSKIERANYR